jgi:L-fuconate dehydratase
LRIVDGHYAAPGTPGFSAQMHASSITEYTYPGGTFWSADLASAATA